MRNEIKLLVDPLKALIQDTCANERRAVRYTCLIDPTQHNRRITFSRVIIQDGIRTFKVLQSYLRVIMSFFRVGEQEISNIIDKLCDYRSLIELHVRRESARGCSHAIIICSEY